MLQSGVQKASDMQAKQRYKDQVTEGVLISSFLFGISELQEVYLSLKLDCSTLALILLSKQM